ncbi:pyruvate dehydrogenase E2 component (dihydrolipoamide acetyltransferase) [Lysinibacillus sp. RC46]|uniref:dihydrolipoamide acetyltransferase family protein n=1 Tax=unclassified Lysinibacillus TaxID=2636778 RepID=UPI00351818F2
MYDFLLPDIGEGLHEAEIVGWFVKQGQKVAINEPLVEVQTDKAVVEITAPITGVIEELGGEEGNTIKVGSLLCQFSKISDSSPTQKTQPLEEKKEESILKEKTEFLVLGRVKAAPSVRKAARTMGINIEEIQGSGSNGRVLRCDLDEHAKQSSSAIALVQNKPKHSEDEANENKIIPIRGLRKAIFENMQKAVSKAVLCTGMEKINVTNLVAFRKSVQQLPEMKDKKLTYLPFLIKAVATALQEHEQFNAKVDEDQKALVIFPYIHIGVAVATSDGLLVPVIKHANKKSIFEITEELESLLGRVLAKKATVEDLTGSTFTISSTGKDGAIFATPITNYPEVAILGFHKIVKEPIVVEDTIQIGHSMTLSCTFDHRVIDGEPVGAFMRSVAGYLEEPVRFLL